MAYKIAKVLKYMPVQFKLLGVDGI